MIEHNVTLIFQFFNKVCVPKVLRIPLLFTCKGDTSCSFQETMIVVWSYSSIAIAWFRSNNLSWTEIKTLKGHLRLLRNNLPKMQKCKSAFRWSMWNNNQNGKETKIQNSKNARSALTECYVHVKHNILEEPGKHIKCMINPGIEWYVHVKMVIILPRKMLIRKLQRQKLKFSLRNHTFVHLRTSGENWEAFFQVHLTVIRFSAP